jgi:hypothetical protein
MVDEFFNMKMPSWYSDRERNGKVSWTLTSGTWLRDRKLGAGPGIRPGTMVGASIIWTLLQGTASSGELVALDTKEGVHVSPAGYQTRARTSVIGAGSDARLRGSARVRTGERRDHQPSCMMERMTS